MKQNSTNQKIIIGMVVVLFLLLVPISFFLFEEVPVNPNPTNPIMQNTTTLPTTSLTQPTVPPSSDPSTNNSTTPTQRPSSNNTKPSSNNTKPSSNNTKPSSNTTTPTTNQTPSVDVNGTFTITENGAGKATVIISQNYTQKTLDAANDLLNYIEKISGVVLDFDYDNGTMGTDRFYILVGPSKYTTQVGVSQPAGYPNNEKLIVKRVKNALVLIGNDDGAFTGTQFAVTRFLEELGCGWFGVGTLWQVVPNTPNISIQQMNIEETPRFTSRANRFSRYNTDTMALAKRWYMGGVEAKVGEHFLSVLVKNSEQTSHPEWFAKNSNGTLRYPVGQEKNWPETPYWQFCYSNASFQNEVASRVIQYFRDNPNCMVYSITPNDGWTFKTCQCAGCRAYSSETEYIINFANKVADIVAKTYPDRQLSILTYHTTLTAPTRSYPVRSNVEIMFCTETSMTKPIASVGYIGMSGGSKINTPWSTNFNNYVRNTGVQHRSVWKWLCIAAESVKWADIPWVEGNVATDNYTYWKTNNVKYVFFDVGPGVYNESVGDLPLRWPLWYVAYKGCWTNQTGEQMLADACKKLYGNGADVMLAYYKALSAASRACTADSHAWRAPDPKTVYTSAQIRNIDNAIAAAEAKLNQVTAVEAQRMRNQINLWKTAKGYIS